MIKNLINIAPLNIIITLVRRCRHTQGKLRREIIHHFLIASSTGMMRLIINTRIKIIPRKMLQIFLFTQCLHRCKYKICVIITIISRNQTSLYATSENTFKRCLSLARNLIAMYQKQYSLKSQFTHCKCRSIRLTSSCCRNQKSLVHTSFPQFQQIVNKRSLHRIRL